MDLSPFDTAEQHKIRVVVVTKGLSHPWGLAFLPDRAMSGANASPIGRSHLEMLVTERAGRIRLIRDGVVDPNPVSGVPKVFAQQLSGLMDIALHPRFSENKLVYFTYTKPLEKGVTTALARARLDGHPLLDVGDIFVADSTDDGRAAASRIVFAPDATLYMTVGGTFDQRAQDPKPTPGGERNVCSRSRTLKACRECRLRPGSRFRLAHSGIIHSSILCRSALC
jgi:glucose/arabinose dehydrogenase